MKRLLSATACVFLLAACSDSGDGFVTAEPSEEGIVSANPIEASQTNEQPPPSGMAAVTGQTPAVTPAVTSGEAAPAAMVMTPSSPAATPEPTSPVEEAPAAPAVDGAPQAPVAENDPAAGAPTVEEPGAAVPAAEPIEDAQPTVTPAGDSAYPAGPYGVGDPEVGEVIEDLSLRGYFNLDPTVESKNTELRDGNLQELRASGMTHMAVVTAATWCGSCRSVAREMGNDLQERIAAAAGEGGIVAQMVLDITQDSEVVAWAQAADLSTLVLVPGNERALAVFDQREFAYVIDLETMKVVFAEHVGIYTNPSAAVVVMDKLEEFIK